MRSGDDTPLAPACFDQAGTHGGQAVAARNGADEQSVHSKRMAEELKGEREVVDAVQRSNRHGKIVSISAEIEPVFFYLLSASGGSEQRAGVHHVNFPSKC
jgi:hypothetical protein